MYASRTLARSYYIRDSFIQIDAVIPKSLIAFSRQRNSPKKTIRGGILLLQFFQAMFGNYKSL